jgi:hypothetical protein
MALTREQMIQEMKLADMREALKQDQIKQSRMTVPDEVVDEMPEWLADADRLKAKNLTNNEAEQVAFLQKQYPDAEVKSDGSRVLLRKKGEQKFGVLDPSFSIGRMFSTEGLRDLGDIGSDIIQGGAEVAGAAMGAPGGIAGVMAGSAGGAGAASLAKEKLAQLLGVKEEADIGNVVKDMAWGGALPGVFHVGGKAVKATAQKVIPSLYSKATGVPVPLLNRMATTTKVDPVTGKPSAILGDDIVSKSSDEALGSIEDLQKTFGDDVAKRIDDVSKQYSASEAAGGAVDVTPVVSHIDNELMKLKQLVDENPTSGTIRDRYNELLRFRLEEIGPQGFKPKKMKISAASKLRNMLDDKYLPAFKEDVGQWVGKGVSPAKENAARDMRRLMKDQMNVATGGQTGKIDSDFIKVTEIGDFGRDYLNTPKKALATMKKISEGADDELMGRFQRLPKELQDQIMSGVQDKSLFDFFKSINKKRVVTEDALLDTAANKVLGKSPIEKLLGAGGAAAGYVSGGPIGGVIGAGLGRGAGKLVASPKSVLRAVKAGKATKAQMEAFEKMLRESPKFRAMVLGSGAAATQD